MAGEAFAIMTAMSIAAEQREERFIKTSARRGAYAALFAAITVVVLAIAYIPILRVHQSWEDEVYWASTCLSLLRHNGPTPSVLADYPTPQSPLYFYGPTLFWLGTLVLKVFGFSMRTWRSFTFAGNVAFLAAVSVLFYRLRRSWTVAMGTALVFSLAIGSSFTFSLPGRPDGWTLALITLAIALAASAGDEPLRRHAGRWTGFGILLGIAATTTPRSWPLLLLMVLLLPLLIPGSPGSKVRTVALAVVSAAAVSSILLLPLRTSLWGFVAFVRRESRGDAVDVSPLMGGNWGFGHATTQAVYYGALLVIVGLVYLLRWRNYRICARSTYPDCPGDRRSVARPYGRDARGPGDARADALGAARSRSDRAGNARSDSAGKPGLWTKGSIFLSVDRNGSRLPRSCRLVEPW
jgi:hypothetical protein